MATSSSNESKEVVLSKINEHFTKKDFSEVIRLTKNACKEANCEEYKLKTRFYSLFQQSEYVKVISDIVNLLRNEQKEENFNILLQKNYKKLKERNVLFDLIYAYYKLGQYKKVVGCLKYCLEKDKKGEESLHVLYSQANFKLGNFKECVRIYEGLLYDKEKFVLMNSNLFASYLGLYIQMLFEYSFYKKQNNMTTQAVEWKHLKEIKEKMKKSTKNFKYADSDPFELFFNYAIFYTVEHNYEEALKFLELAEEKCRRDFISYCKITNHTEYNKTNIEEVPLESVEDTVVRTRLLLIRFYKSYVYSKTSSVKQSLEIYEDVISNYNCVEHVEPNILWYVVSLAYNNYLAIKFNENQKMINAKVQNASKYKFQNINDKLTEIKQALLLNLPQVENLTTVNRQVMDFNTLLQQLHSNLKEETQEKLNFLQKKYPNSILIDQLKILHLKMLEQYEKCRMRIFKNIDLAYSLETKIKILNAYITLCLEKKNYTDVEKIYVTNESVFAINSNDYGVFFSNLFYIYICTNFSVTKNEEKESKKRKKQVYNSGRNVTKVLHLFEKYKSAIKKDTQVVVFETLFLVSRYLINEGKGEILTDLYEYLANQLKNNIQFFACFTYILTHISMSTAPRYVDKLKKMVFSEVYMIDVEELENRTVSWGVNNTNKSADVKINAIEKTRVHRKRKRRKTPNKTVDPNYDHDKWLPKHEKPGYKKKKKKMKKEIMIPRAVSADKTKNTKDVEKLQNLQKRKKKK